MKILRSDSSVILTTKTNESIKLYKNTNESFKLYNQDKVKKPFSQAKNHKKIHFIQEDVPWNLFKPFPKVMSPVGMILAVSDEYSRVLDVLIRLDRKHPSLYPRQDNIAKWAKVSLSTAKRAIKYFAKYGFIGVKNNGCNKSCWYKVSEFFNDLDVKKQLSKKLSIFYFTITALLSVNTECELRSINVFNFIKSIDRSNSISISNRKSNFLAKSTKKEVGMIDKLKNEFGFGDYELKQLREFDDSILKEAYSILKKKAGIKSPYPYLMKVCRTIDEKKRSIKSVKKAANIERETVIRNDYKPVHPPVPSQRLTYDENLERFGRWYTEHAEKYAAIGYRQTPEGYARRFVEKLNRLFADPQRLETLKQDAIEVQNQFSIPAETIPDDGSLASIMAKIAQQSKSNSSFAGENNNTAVATVGLSNESPRETLSPTPFPNGPQISPTTNEAGAVESFIENEENVECEFEFI